MSETPATYTTRRPALTPEEVLQKETDRQDSERLAIALERRKGLLILLRAEERELRLMGWEPKIIEERA